MSESTFRTPDQYVEDFIMNHGITSVEGLQRLIAKDPNAFDVFTLENLFPKGALERIQQKFPDKVIVGDTEYKITYKQTLYGMPKKEILVWDAESLIAMDVQPRLANGDLIEIKYVSPSGQDYSTEMYTLFQMREILFRTFVQDKWNNFERDERQRITDVRRRLSLGWSSNITEKVAFGDLKIGYDPVSKEPIYKTLYAKARYTGYNVVFDLPRSFYDLEEVESQKKPKGKLIEANFGESDLLKSLGERKIKPGKEAIVSDALNKLKVRKDLLKNVYDGRISSSIDARGGEITIEAAQSHENNITKPGQTVRLQFTEKDGEVYVDIVVYNLFFDKTPVLRFKPKAGETIDINVKDQVYVIESVVGKGIVYVSKLPDFEDVLNDDSAIKVQRAKIDKNVV